MPAYSEYATNYIDPVSGRKIPQPCCKLFIPALMINDQDLQV